MNNLPPPESASAGKSIQTGFPVPLSSTSPNFGVRSKFAVEATAEQSLAVIPFMDLHAQHRVFRAEARATFDRLAETADFSSEADIHAFEHEFAAWCGVRECVAVNSITSALHLALRCLEIGPGDEVITVPMTSMETVSAIYYVGAKPVFVDIDPVRRTMNPLLLAEAVNPCTKAIIPVHLHGQMADMRPILDIAMHHGIPVIEDVSQAHGASYERRWAGGYGLMSCFSFHPGENSGTHGEGGALVTSDRYLAERARQLRNHGRSGADLHEEVGYNYSMSSLQAALLSLKLKHLERWGIARAFRAIRYGELLADLPLKLPSRFVDAPSSWEYYVVETDRRDELKEALKQAQIGSALQCPVPLHLQPACKGLGHQAGDFPHSESLARRGLALPIYAELTEPQIQRIASVVRATLMDEVGAAVGSPECR